MPISSNTSKEILTKELTIPNNHERDSAAAVMTFVHQNTNKLRMIKKVLREKNLSEYESEINRYVLTGVRLTDALESLEVLSKPKVEVITRSKDKPNDNSVLKLRAKSIANDNILLASLLQSNSVLKSRLSILFAEKKSLEDKVKHLESEYGANIKVDKLLNTKNTKIKKLELLLKRFKSKASAKLQLSKKKPNKMVQKEELDLEEIVEDYRNEHQNDS